MRAFAFLLLSISVVLSFQNCGSDVTGNPFSVDSDTSSASADCPTGYCTDASNYLWMRIREYEPYKVSYRSFQDSAFFIVGGECGISTYPNHVFVWSLKEAFGADQNEVANGSTANACEYGRFTLAINPNVATMNTEVLYILSVELVGLTSTNLQEGNPQSANSADLDVIFTLEEE